MEAWLNAHALNPVKRPVWVPELVDEVPEPTASRPAGPHPAGPHPAGPHPAVPQPRRSRSAESLRRQLREAIETLGTRELDQLAAFGEFLVSRRAARPSNRGSNKGRRPRDTSPSISQVTEAEPTSGEVPAKLVSVES